jgi:hypothetical protein
MILDGALQFTGTAGNTAAMVDSPTTGTQQSTNVIDLVSARDMGIGDDPAIKLLVQIMTALTGGTSIDVQLQGAPDNGSGLPGTYTTMWDSGVILEADLLAGRYIANVDLPRIWLPSPYQPGKQVLPRFLRLQYVNAGTHGAGTLFGALVLDRQDQISYPPGVVIAN